MLTTKDELIVAVDEAAAAGCCPCWFGRVSLHEDHCCFRDEDECHMAAGKPGMEAAERLTRGEYS